MKGLSLRVASSLLSSLIVVTVGAALVACGRPIGDRDNQPPLAVAGPDLVALVGEAVSLDGSGSSDADGTIESFDWDLGDGNRGEGATLTHTWSAAGGYVVALTVTDDDTATARDSLVVQVTEALPVAHLVASSTSAVVGQEVSFDGRGSSGPSPVATWAWSFGDGGTASGPQVAHTWSSAGSFPVRLTVTDQQGLEDDVEMIFEVTAADVAGTWDVVADAFACSSYEAPFPDATLVVSQSGESVTAVGANGRSYEGTIDGEAVVLSGDVVLDTGSCGSATVHVVMQGSLAGGGSFSGRATGFYDLGIGCQCSAVWDFVATRR